MVTQTVVSKIQLPILKPDSIWNRVFNLNQYLLILSTLFLLGCATCDSLDRAIANPDRTTELKLKHCDLAFFPPEIFTMTNLKVLDLYNNKIDSIPAEIGQLKSLEVLILSKNELVYLPDELFELPNLKVLSLHHNNLASLPANIGNLKNLEELRLDYNELTWLPESIGELKKLETLFLERNRLVELPSSIGGLERLRFFYIRKNFLTAIPNEIGNLTNMVELDVVDSGALLNLPESLCSLTKLEILRVDVQTQVPYCLLNKSTRRFQVIVGN